MIGMEGLGIRARLLYTRDYLTTGISRLSNLNTKEKLVLFPEKKNTVMLWIYIKDMTNTFSKSKLPRPPMENS